MVVLHPSPGPNYPQPLEKEQNRQVAGRKGRLNFGCHSFNVCQNLLFCSGSPLIPTGRGLSSIPTVPVFRVTALSLRVSSLMDPRCTGDILKHLEKQNELLTNAYNSMSHELHKLQVEEEMLMRKFYQLMAAHGLTKKKEGSEIVSDGDQIGQSTALLTNTSDVYGDGEVQPSSDIVPVTTTDEQQ